jgi:hypothetical protein
MALREHTVMRDERVYDAFLSVLNLLEPQEILFRPSTVVRVLRAGL